MSRTAVAVGAPARTNTPPSSGTVPKQAIDAITGAGNGIKFTDFFLNKNGKVFVENTSGSIKVVTLVAGLQSEAINAGVGDSEISVAIARNATSPLVIDQIESSQFKQTGDDLFVEFEAGMTGYCYAVGEAAGLG
jgi:hypothetical protein